MHASGDEFPVKPGRVSCSIRDTACIWQPCDPQRNVSLPRSACKMQLDHLRKRAERLSK
jgi:hypothetical protein